MSGPDSVRSIALGLASTQEGTTWGRPTFRVGETIFAALHNDLLILRGGRDTQAARLAQDSRLRPAPHWGRDGWVAIPLDQVTDQELPDLLTDAHDLACGATR
jgi:predicted DNA-binding protein (MmcQ/YjbR family)